MRLAQVGIVRNDCGRQKYRQTNERRTVVVGVRRVACGEGVAVERGAQAHRANLVFDLETLYGQMDAGFDGELALGADDGRACRCRTGGA